MSDNEDQYNKIVAKNKQLRELLQQTVDELSIIDESYGISGWHLNGDVASWAEFGLLNLRADIISTLEDEG